jgi:hypothetical protein
MTILYFVSFVLWMIKSYQEVKMEQLECGKDMSKVWNDNYNRNSLIIPRKISVTNINTGDVKC